MSRPCNRRCNNCNGYGHVGRECSSPASNTRWCRLCGDTGHYARQCRNPYVVQVGCSLCHGIGHIIDHCPNLCMGCIYGEHDRAWCPRLQCSLCAGMRHTVANCTNPSPGPYCQRCGVRGHTAQSCSSQEGAVGCLNCGGVGHSYGGQVPCPLPFSTIPFCPTCGTRHLPRDCPFRTDDEDDPYFAFAGLGVCALCTQPGHSQFSCPDLNP